MDSVVSACMAYLEDHLRLSKNTLLSYERDIRQYIAFLRTLGINEAYGAGRTVIARYIESLNLLGKSPSTISRCIASLRVFYRYLIRNGYIEGNPLIGIQAPRIAKRPPRAISELDLSKLIQITGVEGTKNIRDRLIMELIYEAGLKVSELIALDVDHIDVVNHCILLQEGAKQRKIVIRPHCMSDVSNYIVQSRPYLLKTSQESALFLNSSGKRFSRQGIWKIITKYTKMAQLENKITPCILRHTFRPSTVD